MSASGLLLIKTGAEGTGASFTQGLFSLHLTVRLLCGLLLYVGSFLLSIYIMSRMKLSIFYPVGTGSILVLTSLFGYFFLKEQIGTLQLIGMLLILSGVIAMNIKV
jgi:multidrug transporter EmrE-like cation transporter